MTKRFPSIFSFSKLAMVAVAAMVVFSSPGVAEAKSTASGIVRHATTPSDTPMRVDGKMVTGQNTAQWILGAMFRGFNQMQKFWPKGEPKLYCLPEKMQEMHVSQLAMLLSQQIERAPSLGSQTPESALLMTLADVFPCK